MTLLCDRPETGIVDYMDMRARSDSPYERPVHSVRRRRAPTANAGSVQYFAAAESFSDFGEFLGVAYGNQNEDAEFEPIVAHTNIAVATEDLAKLLDLVSRPVDQESVPLNDFDPDDYPLF